MSIEKIRIEVGLKNFLVKHEAYNKFISNVEEGDSAFVSSIEEGFTWASSKEGFEFWSNLSLLYWTEKEAIESTKEQKSIRALKLLKSYKKSIDNEPLSSDQIIDLMIMFSEKES